MKASKITRKPIVKKHMGELLHVAPFTSWEVKTEGHPIYAQFLADIQDGELILRELNIFLRSQKSKRGVANRILRYLKFVANLRGAVSVVSLKEYKHYLDNCTKSEANTKSQLFSSTRAFVKHLMSVKVIPQDILPNNFQTTDKKNIPTFSEIAFSDKSLLDHLVKHYTKRIEYLKSEYQLDQTAAATLHFNSAIMEFIHERSLEEVHAALADIYFVKSLVENMTDAQKSEYISIENFSDKFGDKRNVEECFLILYCQNAVDRPVESWPKGTYDFLKTRGWKSDQIRRQLLLDNAKLADAFTSLADAQKKQFSSLKSYAWADLDSRSVELALTILYALFGNCIPNTEKWPEGLSDYLKYRGWSATRVQSAFFPGSYIQKPLFMAMLSHHDLAPNVDTVFFYTYTTALTKSIERGLTTISMAKERGQGVQVDLKNGDPLIIVLKEYISIFKTGVDLLDFAKGFFSQEFVPIFGHVNREKPKNYVVYEFESYDRSTPSNWVKTKLKEYSKSFDLLNFLTKNGATGQNFRPTHVAIDVLKGVGVGRIKRKLNHSSFQTTKSYVRRVELSSQLSQKAYKFQEFLVSQAMSGYSNNSTDKPQAPVENERILKMSEMLKSKKMHRTFISDPSIVAEWIAFSEKIVSEKDRLMFSNPSRWANYWEVILAEYQALLSLVSTKDFHKAEELAKHIHLPYLD